MNITSLYALLSRVTAHKFAAPTPAHATYWDAHWKRLYRLARQVGWPL